MEEHLLWEVQFCIIQRQTECCVPSLLLHSARLAVLSGQKQKERKRIESKSSENGQSTRRRTPAESFWLGCHRLFWITFSLSLLQKVIYIYIYAFALNLFAFKLKLKWATLLRCFGYYIVLGSCSLVDQDDPKLILRALAPSPQHIQLFFFSDLLG